ncbi:GNAT family N-acetyltransferase [Rossellomorea sp. y25]|uniref:GNAT family N-acetyltransferase n=1 Tax=Rossellomorea sp. y25 TaxID=3118174 RepID=UPI0026162F67|nr:GNAT family N-acetyltransferase [uncultured Rossellomorea sp.]
MGTYELKLINNLLDVDLAHLVEHSKEEGFRFVERLVNDYRNGNNTFNRAGEGIFGVFNENGILVAIGGLNKDPFSTGECIGRMRRFYVSKEFRRSGVGNMLVQRIIDEARNHYDTLVLHTDTEQGDAFYRAIGFSKGELYSRSSHYLSLG